MSEIVKALRCASESSKRHDGECDKRHDCIGCQYDYDSKSLGIQSVNVPNNVLLAMGANEIERLTDLLEAAARGQEALQSAWDKDKAELAKYKATEAEGRLWIAPLKPGDDVYIKGKALSVSFVHIDDDLTYVCQFDCDNCDGCPLYEKWPLDTGEFECRTSGYIEFTSKDIGVTVFLNPENAVPFDGVKCTEGL